MEVMKDLRVKKVVFTQELKDKWIEALQSGDYVQGTGALRFEYDGVTKHCCLGVLGEVCGVYIEEKQNYSCDPYDILPNKVTQKLWSLNDNHCDGKYSAVLPIIEGLEVSCG